MTCFRPNLCVAVCLTALALSLQGCGRRGPLEPPPGATPTNAPLTGEPDQNSGQTNAANLPGFVPQASGSSLQANTPAAPGAPIAVTPAASAAPAAPGQPQAKAPARPFLLDPLL